MTTGNVIRPQIACYRARADDKQVLRTRILSDGSRHTIVKLCYEPAALRADLARHGFTAEAETTGRYVLYASGLKSQR